MAKIRATIVLEWEIPEDHLVYYESDTIQDAAKFEQRMYDENIHSVEDFISFAEENISVKVEGIE